MITMMIAAFFIAWMPYTVTSAIVVFGYGHLITAPIATMPAVFAKASILYNPVIYVLMNPQVLNEISCTYVPTLRLPSPEYPPSLVFEDSTARIQNVKSRKWPFRNYAHSVALHNLELIVPRLGIWDDCVFITRHFLFIDNVEDFQMDAGIERQWELCHDQESRPTMYDSSRTFAISSKHALILLHLR